MIQTFAANTGAIQQRLSVQTHKLINKMCSFKLSNKHTLSTITPNYALCSYSYPMGFLAAWKALIVCSTALLTVQLAPSTANEHLDKYSRE